MVKLPEEYPYSSHRAYLGLEEDDLTDADPVLRLFGSKRESAREKLQTDRKLAYARDHVEKIYLANIADSQT